MDFYTIVFKKSERYWVALCLENGLVGQGFSKENALEKLKEAVDSLQEVRDLEKDLISSPISIKELHEFLSVENTEPVSTTYELRAVHA
ncbi:MAG: type II toxin-antitoxin system HicB family antitoxin [Thermodesulfobacteriota bacterium]|nr:type II toxin-antitoxin system HicB family antitoxin [Thermodesulfobacteriota bacterium]